MIKIDLGCGNKKLEGFDIYFDKINFGFNVVCDFEHDKLPLEDESIDYIWSHHVLEHLRDVQNILNECWRVLKPGAIFEITVPWGLWRGAQKPVHYQCITDCWFDWLRRDEPGWYGYKPWVINKMNIRRGDEGPYEIHVLLTPKK